MVSENCKSAKLHASTELSRRGAEGWGEREEEEEGGGGKERGEREEEGGGGKGARRTVVRQREKIV